MYLLRFTSVARGHHVYKKIWKPVIGETLVCRHDTRAEAKQYDDFAVGIYHVPIEFSFLLCKFLIRDSCILKFSPAGARMLEDGHSWYIQCILQVKNNDQYLENRT